MSEVKMELSFEDLERNCWSGATDTLKTVRENDKEEELMEHLEEIFYNTCPTMTELNDYLWFDSEGIFESIGITEEDEEEEE